MTEYGSYDTVLLRDGLKIKNPSEDDQLDVNHSEDVEFRTCKEAWDNVRISVLVL